MLFYLILLLLPIALNANELKIGADPPAHGDFGGRKENRVLLMNQLLSTLTPEQKAIVNDDNALIEKGIVAFNQTFLVQVHAYSILKASISLGKSKCDTQANRRADEIINKSRDATVACLATFRDIIIRGANGATNIQDVPRDVLVEAVYPTDECFQNLKKTVVKDLAQVTVDHIVCTKKP